jgi:peptide/nickel transport system ATP-binding protein
LTADATPPLLEVRDLRIAFPAGGGAPVHAVRGVDFTVPADRCVALVGESGSGKSACALAIMRLLPENAAVHGEVLFAGRNLLALPAADMRGLRGAALSMIFQEPMSSLNPVFTVGAQIAEVLRIHERLSRRAARNRAVELLAEVGLPEPGRRSRSHPHELSGGQQQRVMIAIAIACKPRLLIADEPTTALDVTIQKQILELLAQLRRSRAMSILFISHDLGVVGEIADDVIVLRHGRICEQGTVRQIFTAPAHAYTGALLSCRPTLGSRPRRLPVVADFLPGRAAPADLEERAPRTGGGVVLEAHSLSKSYGRRDDWFRRRDVPALSNVSFTLCRGRTLGVVGESGSGKSTLALMLVRLAADSGGSAAGRVILHDQDGAHDFFALPERRLRPLRRRMQIVFQNPYASLNPRFTVGRILAEPLRLHGIGADEAERLALTRRLLDRVGLPAGALSRHPHEFSGGQRQRIAIARCLTMQPDVLICDESVSALDLSVQAQVLNLLLDLQDEFGLAYVFISHDLAVVRHMSDDVLVLDRGEIVELADADSIYRTPRDPRTRRLLEAVPRGYDGATDRH